MLQQVVTDVAGTPEEAMVNVKLLRSLQQARYSPDPLGHFGLAAKYYSHFTSPIRRYPDLVAHRMIREYAHSTSDDVKAKWKQVLPDIAVQTSTAERRSVDTERAVDDLKKAEYMEDKVGQEFDAVVSSVLSFGMFVELPNTVEGLVHISNMTDDYYQFVEQQMALVGAGSHRMYRIGQPVRVRLENVDVEQHNVDFVIVDPDQAPAANFDTSDIKKPQPRSNNSHGGKPSFGGRNHQGNGRGGNRHPRGGQKHGKQPFNQIHMKRK